MREVLFQVIDSILPIRSAVYAAGPLESGRLIYETQPRFAEDVLSIRSENQARLSMFVEQLRRELPYPVIDPGLLRIEGWEGRDYGEFFIEVIHRYVREAWFLDDWEFSSGASKEFIVCQTVGIPCYNHIGELIDRTEGQRLITKAAEFVEQLGGDSSKLRSRIAALETMQHETDHGRNTNGVNGERQEADSYR
jgi:hypothetical protein